jgi:hypothetical protein
MPTRTVHEYAAGGATRLLALVLLVAPTAAAPFVLGEREVRVVCTRTGTTPREGVCAIEHARVLAVAREEVPLASILRARLDGTQSGATAVVLVLPGEPLVVATELAAPTAEALVRDVNAFLADAASRRVEARAPRGAGLGAFYGGMVAVLAVLGALAYRSAPRVRVELDVAMDAIRVVRRTWPLPARARSLPRADVADAVVEGIPQGAPDRFRVTLVRKDGGREPLTGAYHAGARAPHDALAAAIRAFAGSEASGNLDVQR